MDCDSTHIEETIQILRNNNDDPTFPTFNYLKYTVVDVRKIFILMNKHLSCFFKEQAIKKNFPFDPSSLYSLSYTQCIRFRQYLLENPYLHFTKSVQFINFLLSRWMMGTNNKSVQVFRYLEKHFRSVISPSLPKISIDEVCIRTQIRKELPSVSYSPGPLSTQDIEREIDVLKRKRSFESIQTIVSSSSLSPSPTSDAKKPRTYHQNPKEEKEKEEEEIFDAISWIDTILV